MALGRNVKRRIDGIYEEDNDKPQIFPAEAFCTHEFELQGERSTNYIFWTSDLPTPFKVMDLTLLVFRFVVLEERKFRRMQRATKVFPASQISESKNSRKQNA